MGRDLKIKGNSGHAQGSGYQESTVGTVTLVRAEGRTWHSKTLGNFTGLTPIMEHMCRILFSPYALTSLSTVMRAKEYSMTC